jgi:hypothetical protein
MTRLSKAQRANYNHVVGSRREVQHGSAHHTSGGLTKKDLFFNKKTGRIVSLKKHQTAKKEQRLRKHGYGAKKGKFGYVLLNGRKGKKSMKKRGGFAGHLPLSPSNFDGEGVGTSGVALQEVAGQAGGRRRRRTMKRLGGFAGHLPLSPSNFDGEGVGTSGVALQEVAGQAGGSNVLEYIKNSMYANKYVGGRRRRRNRSTKKR